MKEFHKRTLVKAICWRIIATTSTMVIVYILSGEAKLSLGVGVADVVVKLAIYYGHERLWNHITWGKPKHPLEKLQVCRELDPQDLEEIRKRLDEMGYL
jgi:uncharacterized membrane protein